jgi:hypothetical protein
MMSFKMQRLNLGKQFETNIGLDLGIFNNRVQFTTDVYSRKAFDLETLSLPRVLEDKD